MVETFKRMNKSDNQYILVFLNKKKLMTSNASLSFDMNQEAISKDPDVLAPSADISYPSAPTFQRLDLPTQVLIMSDSRKELEINKGMKSMISHLKVLDHWIDEAKKFIPFLYSLK